MRAKCSCCSRMKDPGVQFSLPLTRIMSKSSSCSIGYRYPVFFLSDGDGAGQWQRPLDLHLNPHSKGLTRSHSLFRIPLAVFISHSNSFFYYYYYSVVEPNAFKRHFLCSLLVWLTQPQLRIASHKWGLPACSTCLVSSPFFRLISVFYVSMEFTRRSLSTVYFLFPLNLFLASFFPLSIISPRFSPPFFEFHLNWYLPVYPNT